MSTTENILSALGIAIIKEELTATPEYRLFTICLPSSCYGILWQIYTSFPDHQCIFSLLLSL